MLGTSGFVLLVAVVAAVFFLIVLAVRTVTRRRTPPISSAQFQALAEEHRRMSDRALTASEHVDLRLADLSARVDELRSQVQRILTDVE
jgi:hypothetical protein